MMKQIAFKRELALIENEEIREFTRAMTEYFPEQFWYMPASSTGKYHPPSSLGKYGLVIHTKQVFWTAYTILETGLYKANRDVVLSACILHDGWKYKGNSRFTLRHHAQYAAEQMRAIISRSINFGSNEPEWLTNVLNCVQSHNGHYSQKEWSGYYSMEQKIVHTADLIASRRFFSFNENAIN